MPQVTYLLSGDNRPNGTVPNTGLDPLTHDIIINFAGFVGASVVRSFSVVNGVFEWANYYVQNHGVQVSQHSPPIFDGFGGFLLGDYFNNGLHRFNGATGAYVGIYSIAIHFGNNWLVVGTTRRVGGTSYLAIMRATTMVFLTYNGTTFSQVGATSGVGHGNRVYSIDMNPGVAVFTVGLPGPFSTGTISLYKIAWPGGSIVQYPFSSYGLPDTEAVNDAAGVFYNPGDNSLLLTHNAGILKVSATDPSVVLGSLAVNLGTQNPWPSYRSKTGIQSDNRFIMNGRGSDIGTYYLIDANTLAIVATHNGAAWDYGDSGAGHHVVYLKPETAVFKRDLVGPKDTITYFNLSPTTRIVGDIGITGSMLAQAGQPCPIVGNPSDFCLAGYTSVPAGIGQLLAGRDDVKRRCDP